MLNIEVQAQTLDQYRFGLDRSHWKLVVESDMSCVGSFPFAGAAVKNVFGEKRFLRVGGVFP